jgi:hypothetical protein
MNRGCAETDKLRDEGLFLMTNIGKGLEKSFLVTGGDKPVGKTV